jgi:hypothetical protein
MAGRIDRRTLMVGSTLALFPAGSAGREMTKTTDWDSLRRPLHLPALEEGAFCPRSEGKRFAPQLGFGPGNGPVHPASLGPDGVMNYGGGREDGGWFYLKVLWAATPDYAGPILVRGRQLDGLHEVRFEGGADPVREMRLENGGVIVGASGLRNWPSYTRVRVPGCYAYQVDCLDFSEVIVFQAVKAKPGELTPLPAWEEGPNPLPRELAVTSGVRLDDGAVRLALTGAGHLVLRLDVRPAQDAPLDLPGQGVRPLDTTAGTVLWQADPEQRWPRVATWDDGRRRYRLEVLDADPDAWSERDLKTLVEAFAAAPEPSAAS